MTQAPPIPHIIKRDGSIVQYTRSRISNAILKATAASEAPDRNLAESMAEKVEAALVKTYGTRHMPSVEDIQDVVESVLMENGQTRIARKYIIYRHQRAMARAARAWEFEVTDNVPYRKLYEVLRWNTDHDCDSVTGLNRIIADGLYPALVKDADRRLNAEMTQAADAISARVPQLAIAIIAGPSSSGKTTTTIKIGERLAAAGLRMKAINIDHYFFDLEMHPRDEFGDYDYESPQALDLALINEHLVQLLEGKTVLTPNYDFKSGKRTLNVHPFRLDRDEILLIDSLHGLYDAMTESIPAERKFKLYVETLGQFRTTEGSFMRWADNRLLRRMIRDTNFRNSKPIQTLTHWHYVRKSELKNIIPFLKHADWIVNTALPYELPILKRHLFQYVTDALHLYRDDPKRLDAYIRVNRVYDLLNPLTIVDDESCIPDDSLLREFIGGSRYTY